MMKSSSRRFIGLPLGPCAAKLPFEIIAFILLLTDCLFGAIYRKRKIRRSRQDRGKGLAQRHFIP